MKRNVGGVFEGSFGSGMIACDSVTGDGGGGAMK